MRILVQKTRRAIKSPVISMLSFKIMTASQGQHTCSKSRLTYSLGNFCRTLSTDYLELAMNLYSLVTRGSYWIGTSEKKSCSLNCLLNKMWHLFLLNFSSADDVTHDVDPLCYHYPFCREK